MMMPIPMISNTKVKTKVIFIRFQENLLEDLDRYVSEKGFKNRQDAIREILREKLKEGGN
jgi:metal-responsive CopG/Arc/MetJ family transcriptional regulator